MNIKTTFQISLKNKGIDLAVEVQPHIPHAHIDSLKISKKFLDYIDRIDHAQPGVQVKIIQILGVEMFGKKVGFVNMRVITQKDGFPLPGYVFLRGPSVAILLFVNKKILVVEQYRVPIQKSILEAPAGMLDESGDFVGTAATQIEEETSIKICKDKLVSLGSYYPSVGGCDEEILLFYCHIQKSPQQIAVIEQKIHGNVGEKQKIKVSFIEANLAEAILKTQDSKLITLLYAYEHLVGKPSL